VTITDPHAQKKSGAFGAVGGPRGRGKKEGRKRRKKEKERRR
jgi:hypothetical protein